MRKTLLTKNEPKLSLCSVAVTAMLLTGSAVQATVVRGYVVDATNQEPLIGASVTAAGTQKGGVTDIDGHFSFTLPPSTYEIRAGYVGYKSVSMSGYKVAGDTLTLDIALQPDMQTLSEVTVTAIARHDSEVAQVAQQKESAVVQNGVSAQEIAKTQDKDASEVIRRIPGISVIDEKFVMVRGLSQRYNNVWLNGSAVPSSEADSRAFSFDIIPSSQLDNMVIIKSPAPEYPADFTGGFVLVNTRQNPSERHFDISLGMGFNDRTHFKEFILPKGHSSNMLDRQMTYYNGGDGTEIDPVKSGFDNDWRTKTMHPITDLKLTTSYSDRWNISSGMKLGLLAALTVSQSYRTLLNMENSLYGPYDPIKDESVALRKATDNQYTRDRRLGAMLNLMLLPSGSVNRFEWKNIFNISVKDRYSERVGFNAQSDNINDMEYLHTSRPTLNSQLAGSHDFGSNKVDWSAGYAFAQRDLPDRRLIERTDRTEQTMGIYRISREFTRLNEHTASVNANYRHEFDFSGFRPMVKAGLYGDYRTRDYRTREFQYGWQPDNTLPDGFEFNPDVAGGVLVPDNYGPDKLYLYEEVNYLNNYQAHQSMMAGYVGVNIPWKQLDVYAGVRYENCQQVLKMNTRQYEESLHSTDYRYSDLFPSVNATYHFNKSQQLRLAYGRSTNRPEFRELSSSVFYDFDLGSSVMGNPDLKAAYIDNVDLRWEFYPSRGEQISVALFYKHFSNPIEWTYTVSGGTDLVYSFVNARKADNYGVEIDIRKSLGFIGLKDFSLSVNAALIKSRVKFDGTTNNIDRPMQGQSPYLVNAGLFYANTQHGWNASILYNCIGKRIIGVGNRYGTASEGSSRNIPNSYEMPRHSLDLSVSKTFGRWSVKLAARDILAQKFLFRQIEEVVQDGEKRNIEETTRSYKPGRNFNLTIGYKF